MRRLLSFLAISAVFSMSAFAESWTGKLIDASCHAQKATEACAPTAATTSFGLNVAGKVYNFDAAGNSKAAAALKNRADRSQPGAQKSQSADVMAKVDGKEASGTITVENIEVQ
jgi:hypothetical protein